MANRVFSDVEIGFGVANSYKDSSIKWGLVRGREEVSGDGDSPRTVTPAERCA